LAESVTLRPVEVKDFNISVTLALGRLCLANAQAPATWGVAMDVPFQVSYPPPGMDELIPDPGPKRLKKDALFE
jgi:hypothetical protein